MPRLSKKQKRLVKDLHTLLTVFALDPEVIVNDYERESWTPRLEGAKRQLVRSQVITWYTLVDEFLGSTIARFFFPGKRSFPQLWRTKRFRLFNHHILEELSLLQKLRLVRGLSDVPKAVAVDIERLNSLRNGLAHSFFPENLKKSKPLWKGRDIFSVEGVQLLSHDVDKVVEHFYPGAMQAFEGADDVCE